MDLPSLNDIDSNPTPSLPTNNSFSNPNNQLDNYNSSGMSSSTPSTFPGSDFNTNSTMSSNNSFASTQTNTFTQPQIQETPITQNNNNTQNDITKAKFEAVESKVTLIDARLLNIEQKIDKLTQLILSEVSEETRARIDVGTSLNKLKRN